MGALRDAAAAYPARSRKVVWLVVPLALAAAEGLLALISEKGGKDHPGLLLHLTAPCLVWVPLAAGVRLLASRGFSKLRVLQVAAKALGAVLWGAVSVVVTCSWIVYRLTGSFLNLEQLAFAKENAGALLLHLLQTSGIYVLMGFGGCFLLSWATYSGISRLAPLQVTRVAHRVLLVAVFSLMFVAAIGVVLSGEWPTGPVAALAKGILQSQVMEGSPLSLARKAPAPPGRPATEARTSGDFRAGGIASLRLVGTLPRGRAFSQEVVSGGHALRKGVHAFHPLGLRRLGHLVLHVPVAKWPAQLVA